MSPNKSVLRIAVVAGEASGDVLGAGLVSAIKKYHPDAEFFGIGGERMKANGFRSLFPIEKLSIMGIVEVLSSLWELLGIRRQVCCEIVAQQADVFIGIDAPDFNLGLERRVRQQGIPTVHYVSPSVWAWRQGRIKTIRRSTNLMLTLLPFEADFYQQHHMPVKFVGHPLADQIPFKTDTHLARQKLNIAVDRTVVAIVPGSRRTEVRFLGKVFLETAQQLLQVEPNTLFVLPCANSQRRTELEALIKLYTPTLPILLLDGQAQLAMAAADTILIASGTATLEATLLKKPMVVAYRVATLTYWIAKKIVSAKLFSLPNLLAGRQIVPEFIQDAVTVDNLKQALLEQLRNKSYQEEIQAEFLKIHQQLKCNADEVAASAVLSLIRRVAENGQ